MEVNKYYLSLIVVLTHINVYSMQYLLPRKRAASSAAASTSPCNDEERLPTDKTTLSQLLLRNASTDDVDLITSLVERGANPNTTCAITQMTPLHRAAATDKAGVVLLLLQYEANANAQDKYGCTPLHYAASYGSQNTIKYLLQFNANPYIKNQNNLDVYEFIDTYKPRMANAKQIILEEITTIEQFTQSVGGCSPRKQDEEVI